MKKSTFEQLIKEHIGTFQISKDSDSDYSYKIIDAYDLKFLNTEFCIKDCGLDGIQVSFYNMNLKKMQDISHIYHWSDAYEILYMGLVTPEKIIYEDDVNEIVSVEMSLGRKKYDFMWSPDKGIEELDEDVLYRAIQLVKYNYILNLKYDQEIKQIAITSVASQCNENWDYNDLIALLKNESEFYSYDIEEKSLNTSGKEWCMLSVCAYIEYAATNGLLYEVLHTKEKYDTPSGPFQFTWMPEKGLKYINENIYNLACQIVDCGQVKVLKELNENKCVKICISDFYCKECTCFEITTCYVSQVTISNVMHDEIIEDESWISLPVSAPLDNHHWNFDFCEKCIMCGNCVYPYAGYIQYLRESGNEEQIEKDREWYRLHISEVECEMRTDFNYTLSTELFLDVNTEMLEIAELLNHHNYVSIFRNIYEYENSNCFTLMTYQDLHEKEYSLDELKSAILEGRIDRSKQYFYYIYNYDADLKGLKYYVVLAGYIDYLRKTGQYQEYKLKVEQQRQTIEEYFRKMKEDIPTFRNVYDIATSGKGSSLYCVVEGERGSGRKNLIKKIAQLLKENEKIDSSEYEVYTCEEIATYLGMVDIAEKGANTYENQFYIYSGFEKRKLYVLTDLKEFIYKCRNINDGDGSKISHLIKMLGRYQPQTYIIIVGEKKYVDYFLDLSPQIKFLFGNNVLQIENPSTEKLYSIFKANLTTTLQLKLNEESNFKNRFIDYVVLNRKFLPLTNYELANYLADYTNNQKQLILPPDIYRKKSAKEMLDNVIGMENIKKAAYDFEKYAIFLKHAEMNGMELPNSNMHMIFKGNPGTGKTMIARVIGQMLFDLGVVEENKIIEVEAKDLKSQYIGESAIKTANIIDKAMGGVLFIDEAYAIGNDSAGKDTIAALIKAMEDHKDKFVVIFAGYEKEMQEFLNINSGIASRIGYTFDFDDYTVDELVEMFDVKMKKAGFIYDRILLKQIKEICEHFVEKKDFGNGRFVDKIIQRVLSKHSNREITNDNINIIVNEDIPSIEELISTDVVEHKDFESQLQQFIGMNNVKDKMRRFARYVEFQQIAKKEGAKIPAGNMHMIFTGNPGTGKTTIARVMADMLYDIGIIKENKLIEVERKDLVSEHIGETAQKTNEVIERALDGVLFIDEAYTLAPEDSSKDFGAEAIATLIKAMEDHKNDLIVIFAGYKDEMRRFVNANPGIASRIANTFDFEDYKLEELIQMYKMSMERAGFEITDEALKKVHIVIEYFIKKKNFGNGRFIGKLLQETLMIHSEHIQENKSNLLKIEAIDIPEIADINNTPKRIGESKELEQIIGMQNVKERLKEFETLVNFNIVAKEHGLTVPNCNMHMIFTGDPGTGKTTIARIIAQKLYDIGIIMENKLVEVERKDLVAGYVGQTATKVDEVIEKALGGILFIDEAYSLTPKSENDFGGEAIATLIKAMEDHKDNLVVIFAGYEDEMKEFVQSNPGIASRIGFTFHFNNYSPEELKEIFVMKMQKNGFSITESAVDKLEKLTQHFCNMKNFGNGRFVDKVIQTTILRHAGNYCVELIDQIDDKDIPEIEDLAENMTGL